MDWASRPVEQMARLLLVNQAEHNSKLNLGRQFGRQVLYSCVPPVLALFLTVLLGSRILQPRPVAAAATEALHLEVFTGDADSWGVTSTLIYGKTEAVLIDSQFHNSQARKLAERIAALGRQLNAIIITPSR